MAQFQVRTGPIQNNAAGFSPEMAQGNVPPKSRAFLAPRIPLPLFVNVPAFPFESILGSQLDSRNHLTKPEQRQPIVYPHQANPFSPEMAAGTQGQTYPSPRIQLGQKIPLPIAQTTHVQATFHQAMADGVTVPRPRLSFGRQIGQPINVFNPDFAFESVIASRLDSRNHLTWPQHLPPFSQPTHVPAAFSAEMIRGVTIPQPPKLPRGKLGYSDWVFVPQFAFESVIAHCLDRRNHLTRPQHLPPISQTTHVQAPFSIDMVSRVLEFRGRLQRPSQTAPLVVQISDFSFESVLGLRLDSRNHLVYPLHVKPIDPAAHIAATFSPEMAAGAQGPAFQNHFKWWPIGSTTEASLIAIEVPPDAEGVEFTALQNPLHFKANENRIHFKTGDRRIHFEANEKRIHFVLIPKRLHFRVPDEDE